MASSTVIAALPATRPRKRASGRLGMPGGAMRTHSRPLLARVLMLPGAEGVEQLRLVVVGDGLLRDHPRQANGLAHLRQVVSAAWADREMRLEARLLSRRQGHVQVRRHQFDELLAAQIIFYGS